MLRASDSTRVDRGVVCRAGHDDPWPVHEQVPALRRRSPLVSRPAIGWPPTNRRPGRRARATIADLVLATSVITASAASAELARACQGVQLRQISHGRRAGQDDEIGAVDRRRAASRQPRRSCRRVRRGRTLAARRPGGDLDPSPARSRSAVRARWIRRSARSRGTRSASARVSQPGDDVEAPRQPSTPTRRARRRSARRRSPPAGPTLRDAPLDALGRPRARRAGSGDGSVPAVRSPRRSGLRKRRSAGSDAPRRTANRAARPYRSGVRMTSRRDGARACRSALAGQPTAGRPASAASTFSRGYS